MKPTGRILENQDWMRKKTKNKIPTNLCLIFFFSYQIIVLLLENNSQIPTVLILFIILAAEAHLHWPYNKTEYMRFVYDKDTIMLTFDWQWTCFVLLWSWFQYLDPNSSLSESPNTQSTLLHIGSFHICLSVLVALVNQQSKVLWFSLY